MGNRSIAFGLFVSVLPGCVVVPDQGHYAGGVVLVAPPPPRVEVNRRCADAGLGMDRRLLELGRRPS